jgi:gluconolactonase
MEKAEGDMPAQLVTLDVRDPRLTEIIAPDARLEPLATGFQFLEGPVWMPIQAALVFSDIPGDTMYRWNAASGVTVFRRPSRKANGNACDRDGRILTCEHATSRVVRQELDGRLTVIASHYAGLELNSPNDIVVKRDGAIYFTDPNFGRRPTRYGVPREQQQPCQGVYRLEPEAGALARVADDFDQPNGLCFSLDESLLFVNDSARGHIRVFEITEEGGLRGGKVWAEVHGQGPGVPDGMKFDAAGNLYCAGPGGIYVFDAHATCLGAIRMPEQAANFCWGGDDLRDLLVCASTTLYRVRVQIAGR